MQIAKAAYIPTCCPSCRCEQFLISFSQSSHHFIQCLALLSHPNGKGGDEFSMPCHASPATIMIRDLVVCHHAMPVITNLKAIDEFYHAMYSIF